MAAREPGAPLDPLRISDALRRRRAGLLRQLLAPLPRPVRILDVGGTRRFWETAGLSDPREVRILLLNRHAEQTDEPAFESSVGDARDLSRFGDGDFDVAFSNSVIEHLGSHEDQRRMAQEMQRVGRRLYVQTPNRHFPIEPHFAFPCFQFLPLRLRVWLLRHLRLGFVPRTPDPRAAEERVRSIQLLSRRDLASLFPAADIHRERFLGLTKSFAACQGFGPLDEVRS